MKLSIITINRNNADGLRRTMESVFVQSCSDFEYIVVDGASTDESTRVIDEYQSQERSFLFRWISEQDTGVFNAMNKGIGMASGEYLLFLNSGDFLVDSDVVKTFTEYHAVADMAIGKCRVTSVGKTIFYTSAPKDITMNELYYGSLPHQASFIRKNLFERYGLYREDLRLMGDWEFCIRTLILGKAAHECLDLIVADYNVDGMSSAESNRARMEEERLFVFAQLPLCHIIPDYDDFRQYKEQLHVMEWAYSKAYIRKPIEWIYMIALKLHK